MATALVIAMSAGDVRAIQRPSDVDVLPLTPEASLEAWRSGMNVVYPEWGRSYLRQLELQAKTAELTRRVTEELKLGPDDFDDYGFTILASNVVLWRELIRFALAAAPCGCVVLPRNIDRPFPAKAFGTLEEERTWTLAALACQVVREETREVQVRATAIPGRGPIFPARFLDLQSLRLVSGSVMSRSMRTAGRVRRALAPSRSQRARWHATMPLGRPESLNARQVLVLAQPNKVTELLKISVPGVEWRPMSYGDLYAMCDLPEPGPLLLCEPTLSSDRLLREYASSSGRRISASKDRLRCLSQGPSAVLMTDGQHDPLVRKLVSEFTMAGKKVALVPEGCVAYTGKLAPFGTAGSMMREGVTRFVIDEYQLAHWARIPKAQGAVLVTGYLGDTEIPSSPLRRLRRARLARQINRVASQSKALVATLTFDAFLSEIELGRFGDQGRSDLLKDLITIVDALDRAGVTVISKLRDRVLTQSMRDHFKGRRALFVTDTDWQTCVSLSDVLITRDSSVGWEAANSGVPVIVWNFSDYPTFVEEALKGVLGHRGTIVRSTAEVVEAVLAACSTERPAIRWGGPVPSLTTSARTESVSCWVALACEDAPN
jgi:hypothetical protein